VSPLHCSFLIQPIGSSQENGKSPNYLLAVPHTIVVRPFRHPAVFFTRPAPARRFDSRGAREPLLMRSGKWHYRVVECPRTEGLFRAYQYFMVRLPPF
jgi:hypothetical protein